MSPNNMALRKVVWLLAGLTALYFLLWLSPFLDFLKGVQAMTLTTHMAMETFSIVIAMLVFGIAWNAYSSVRPGNVLLLACGFLAVGFMDFGHMLSYKGMPQFVTPNDPEKAIQFWLIARFIAALVLLAVALRPWLPLSDPRRRYGWLGSALVVSVFAYWLVLFHQQDMPHTFIEGQGLTPLKIAVELIIACIMLVPAVLFYLQARSPRSQSYDATSLFAATSISILSELCFILYSSVNDIFNLLGHIYKVIAYVFIYRAVFVSSVREPFQQVQRAKDELGNSRMMLRSILDNVPARIFWKDKDSRYLGANRLFLRDAGVESEERLIGRNDFDFFPEQAAAYQADDRAVMEGGAPKLNIEEAIKTAEGNTAWLLTSKTPLQERDGSVFGVLGTYIDVSERKRARQALMMRDFALNQVREAVSLIDLRDSQFVYVNDEACRELGYSREELMGMTVLDIDSAFSVEEMESLWQREAVDGSLVFERTHRAKDGNVFPVEIHATRFMFDGTAFIITLARNIAERKRHEELEALRLRIFEQIAQSGELNEILELVVRYVELCCHGCLGSIMLVDGEGKRLYLAAAPNLSPEYGAAVDGLEIGEGVGSCGTAAHRGETVIAEDVRSHPYWESFKQLALSAGLLSCWSEPIRNSSGRVLGTFALYGKEPRSPTAEDSELVRRASHFAAIAIERRRAEQIISESREQLRGLTARREQVREDERKYIAREVHDELGQILTGLQLNVAVLKHKFAADSPPLLKQLEETKVLTEKALAVARNVASSLRPASLDMGIASALEWLAGRFAANTDIRCEVNIPDDDIQLEEAQAIALFRIAQESLTNVARHARASRIDIALVRDGDDYVLKVRDNGIGFEMTSGKSNSFGLVGMRERALMLGGEVIINSKRGEGAEVVVRIPVNEAVRKQ